MADLDLRLVRYFTAVAEHRHFGRAAAALHTTQPSLSRQIRRLESRLGARLLDRTPQGTRLTEAGEVFLLHAKELLQSAEQAAASTRAAATPSRVTIGYRTNLFVTPAVRELRRRHPEAEVVTRHLGWTETRAALLEHRVDVAVTRLPLQDGGLRVIPLYAEDRVLLVSADHRLAGRASATLADIADEPLPRLDDPEWNAFWRVDPRPDGRPAPDGPLVSEFEEKFELIAAGQLAAIVPAGVRFSRLRPDVTIVPLADVEPCQVVLATRAGEGNALLASACRTLEAHLTSPEAAGLKAR
ncbi:LysR substrate-binding domain-containing protein [Amycolatopsis tolypomycina]|uniref:DNA-binding transcriptional regulator, LysR family n=1 Tax=Amycolatopsis tolypomycina TaxID=208445 RepID=A0A1H4WWK4_9PSEU|nr:LysR substrate-binding domain-containing protein [Amycolatopsis tolypomycina]SEC97726.1 DNA-binding transcriptional regulator, LysR family [Amycolatopsis tolypomycina]